MESVAKQRRFVVLRAGGLSFGKIAEEIGVSKATLVGWSRKFAVEVSNFREIELEKLREEYLMCKEHRIRMVGTQLGKVSEELLKRDLSEVSTYRLFEMQARLWRELSGEARGVVFMQDRPIGSGEAMGDMLKKRETWEG